MPTVESAAFTIYVAAHERHEAIDAYRDWLTAEQIDEIEEAEVAVLIVRANGVTQIFPEG